MRSSDHGAQRGVAQHFGGFKASPANLSEFLKILASTLRPGFPHATAPASSAHHLPTPLPAASR
eukprot:5569011-Pyramimonas_sp.AAC.1